jgi:endonuclease/exonuclease/phosphatase family metal-dependent hydrolase
MRFASWNIAGGHTFRKSLEDAISYEEENLQYFIDELNKVDADVVVLQEAHTPDDAKEKNQSALIAEMLGYAVAGNHPYSHRSHIKNGNKLTLATLTKHPVVSSNFHQLPNPKLTVTRPDGDVWMSFDVGFLNNIIEYRGAQINISNGHMVPFHYFKRDFSEPEFQPVRDSILELYRLLAHNPTLAGVDFNYHDLQKLLPALFENHLYDEAFVGIETTPGRGQQDHVLFSNHWKLKKAEVRKVTADHFICIADFDLNV